MILLISGMAILIFNLHLLIPTGSIADVRIYNNALTSDQIRQLAVQVPAGLVGRWDFTNNGTTGDALEDVSGWGNTLSASGTPTLSASGGRFGIGDGSLGLDGTDDYVYRNVTTSLPLGNSPRTMCAWYKPTDYPTTAGAQYPIVDQGSGSGTNGAGHLLAIRNSAGTLDLTSGFWNTSDTVYSPYSMYSPQSWQFVCGTWNPVDATARARLYLNGFQIMSDNDNPTHAITDGVNIGRGRMANKYFKGGIDDVRIYNRALSQAEIQVLVTQPNKRIAVSTSTTDGNITDFTGGPYATGIAGADALCASDFDPGYKAMIVDSTPIQRRACIYANCATTGITAHVNWVLRPNVTYVREDGLPIFTANWNGVFDFITPANNPSGTITFQNKITTVNVSPWSGLTQGTNFAWLTEASQTWSNSSDYYMTGDPSNYTDYTSIASGSQSVSAHPIYCVEQ
jgi:hypothetical protein